ncbi:hypothetical protein C8J57DRAFT_1533314 [Mycena rebaudengoi]|nr:hypothetical protein C8J57DRAFT_1533314 [Mycena rebaudengoi]
MAMPSTPTSTGPPPTIPLNLPVKEYTLETPMSSPRRISVQSMMLYLNLLRLTVTGEPFCVGAASNADGAKVVLLGCGVDNAGTDFPATNSTWMAPLVPLTGQFKTYDNKCLDVPNGENKNGVNVAKGPGRL